MNRDALALLLVLAKIVQRTHSLNHDEREALNRAMLIVGLPDDLAPCPSCSNLTKDAPAKTCVLGSSFHHGETLRRLLAKA